jgi:hypothetical protein
MDAQERKTLKKLSGSNFAFFVCAIMRKRIRIEGDVIICASEEFENNNLNLTYLIEKMFYESKYFQSHLVVSEIVEKYEYVFGNELSFLEEEEGDSIQLMMGELAK